jgi:hypothetical protein
VAARRQGLIDAPGRERRQVAGSRLVDKYPANCQVMVLYDPTDPTKAHLEVKRSTGAVILLAFGCLWLAIGTLLVGLSFA